MKILGIETSCDETAASVVELTDAVAGAHLLSNAVASSMDLHAQYGGVIPEIAARSHIEAIIPVITQALADAQATWDDIDAIAVTYGAGLGGSLLIGVLTARTLAITYNKPLYACNHVEGHVYANFITGSSLPSYNARQATPTFPMLAIIVSGGHSQLVVFRNHFDYTLLGQTQDDAIGEAFDKVGKITGLPYPGGPNIERAAQAGDRLAFKLPKAKMSGKYDFSFSGLKTAVLRQAQAMIGEDYTFASKDLPGRLSEAQRADIAAVFVHVAIETIVDKALLAVEEFSPTSVVIAGGVAASAELRKQLLERLPSAHDLHTRVQFGSKSSTEAERTQRVREHQSTEFGPKCAECEGRPPISFPDLKLCTDNAAMIATLGAYQALLGQPTADPYALDIAPNLSM